MKTCIGACGLTKDLNDFYRQSPGVQSRDGHHNQCKICVQAKSKAWLDADPARREKANDRAAAWRVANPERFKAIQARYQAKARTDGRLKSLDRTRKSRVRAASTGQPVSRKAVIARYGLHCFICDRSIDDRCMLVLDHVIPIARGGVHSEDNLRPAHRSCNSWKWDRLSEELVGLEPPVPGVGDEWQRRVIERSSRKKSEANRRRFAAWTTKDRLEHGAKIAAAQTPEARARKVIALRASWSRKTPEEMEAWRSKCRIAKQGSSNS